LRAGWVNERAWEVSGSQKKSMTNKEIQDMLRGTTHWIAAHERLHDNLGLTGVGHKDIKPLSKDAAIQELIDATDALFEGFSWQSHPALVRLMHALVGVKDQITH
jgi:hypothetical protein